MMRLLKRIFIINIVGILALSCQVLKPEQAENEFVTKGELGSIGKFSSSGFMSKDFQEVGAIKLLDPIRVKVTNMEIVKVNENKKNDSVIEDFMESKKFKLELKIIDEVNFIDQLNSSENRSYLEYLKENKKAVLRISGTWIFNEIQAKSILNAKSLYLNNTGLSKYSLEVHSAKGVEEIIEFTDLTLIGGSFMQVCWILDKRGLPRAAALIHKNQKCPGNTEDEILNLDSNYNWMN